MSKTIPATLLTHKGQSSTTLCLLRKIGPLPDESFRYQSSLDVDVEYDDGLGLQTYIARTGYEPSALISTADLGVDNAEGKMFAPVASHELEGITRAQVDAGILDKVPFVVYRVNYKNLTEHEVWSGGTLGEIKWKVGDVLIPEERSLSQQGKQAIGEVDSLTCRAKFGGQAGVDGVRANNACGFLLTAEWVDGLVESVGTETDREFTDSTLTQAANWFAPGVLEWLTGNNAGQKQEVEAFASGAVTLQFPTVNPILLGDTYRIRRECTKNKAGHNSCQTFWGPTEWALHFRGEPAIPVAEAGKLNSPGAALSTSVRGASD